MIDRKQKASGDENFEYEPEKQAVPEVLDKGRIVKCPRCWVEKKFFENCPWCPIWDKQQCECGHSFGKHWHKPAQDTIAKREIWSCEGCLGTWMSEFNISHEPTEKG